MKTDLRKTRRAGIESEPQLNIIFKCITPVATALFLKKNLYNRSHHDDVGLPPRLSDLDPTHTALNGKSSMTELLTTIIATVASYKVVETLKFLKEIYG
jgi:hypothetical protein